MMSNAITSSTCCCRQNRIPLNLCKKNDKTLSKIIGVSICWWPNTMHIPVPLYPILSLPYWYANVEYLSLPKSDRNTLNIVPGDDFEQDHLLLLHCLALPMVWLYDWDGYIWPSMMMQVVSSYCHRQRACLQDLTQMGKRNA
jgi:hypothetical protein